MAPYLRVEGEIKQESKSNLQEELIVARDKATELVDDSTLLHLSLILSKDAQLLEEVKDDEEEIWIVPIEHGYQLRNNVSVLHFALNLQIFCEVQKKMESNEQNLFLLLDHDCKLCLLLAHLLCFGIPLISAFELLQGL